MAENSRDILADATLHIALQEALTKKILAPTV